MKLRFLNISCLLILLFPLTKNLNGEEVLIPHKVIICGIGKNIATPLPQVIKSIEKIGSLFIDYKVAIYENNSSDSTKDQLRNWSNRNSRVDIISEDVEPSEILRSSSSFSWVTQSGSRTEQIARARNILLDYIEKNFHPKYSFIINLDLDFADPIAVDGIIDSFSKIDKWDVVTANGVREEGYYWDSYAFRSHTFPFGAEILTDQNWVNIKKGHPTVLHFWYRIREDLDLIPVDSAFGGLAIYNRSFMKGCRYSGTVTKELATWYANFIHNNPNHGSVKTYLSIAKNYSSRRWIGAPHQLPKRKFCRRLYLRESRTAFYFKGDKNSEINFSLNTDDVGIPTVCEHVPFHISMKLKNNARIFVNPKMKVHYTTNLKYKPRFKIAD
ncbi:MAG: hypothetical protein S4CHLAM37_13330 [Chlamydiia bacterium]|nr:hypothetical protein [Chlamydiia bacterium]